MSKLDKTRMPDDLPEITTKVAEDQPQAVSFIRRRFGLIFAAALAIASTFGCESGCNCHGCSACSVTVDGSGVQLDGCGKKENKDPYK